MEEIVAESEEQRVTSEGQEPAASKAWNDEETEAGAEGSGSAIDPQVAAAEEMQRLRDQLLRTAADFDNYRKRSRREIEDAERRGRETTLRELLPVFDNLERAIDSAKHAQDLAAVAQGVEMVLRIFHDSAAKLGLERLSVLGERFDPALHDAVQQQESAEHAPGTILSELIPGYRLEGRLVRPAMVVVARPPAAAPSGS